MPRSAEPPFGCNMSFEPWQFLLSILAGWINDEQQKIIEYQRTIIQVLQEKHGKKRILLNDDQRRRLAVRGLGRIGAEAKTAEQALVEAFQDADEGVRISAAQWRKKTDPAAAKKSG
jgi:hypothetical protein